jgi:Cu-Zn family superoxide dismutase
MSLRNCPMIVAAAASLVALAACSREPKNEPVNEVAGDNAAEPVAATDVQLIDGTGNAVGVVAISEDANGVTLRLSAAGLPPGTHGAHLHEAGRCDTPDFKSAGAHWNPTHRKHGRDNPEGSHLGDLDNIQVAADGGGSSIFSIGATRNALADADGTSLVIHAKADDYKTDPTGNSGDRIACAVISPPK